MTAAALEGLRVLEVGHIISGPFCGHLFADQGAEVIKVEPAEGDAMRTWGGMYKGVGLYWPVIGRGKKSVTMDLRTPADQVLFRELARTADVVIENFRPGTLERWGVGPDDLRAVNPDLILVRITGYGQTGPMRDVAGFGSIAEAMSGFRHLSGEPDRPPVRVGVSIGDALAGTQGFVGALLALLAGHLRPDRPRGQVVDVALYEAMWMYMEGIVPEFAKLGQVRGPSGPLLPGIAPSSVYPTLDGQWVVMGANKDNVFARLAEVMSRPDWVATDGPYRAHGQRGAAQLELDAAIAEWTARHGIDELLALLEDAGVPAGRIYTAPDILADPHYRAREMVIDVATPALDDETVPMQGVVPKLSHTPGRVSRGAPRLGEHNAELLDELRAEVAERLAATGS
ncbi:CaiB/BaiF CoA transferase family protein [Nocardioides humi]|uniref:CoA transferase n=1 Tax=Nocardioides humi TaxID=449461 RepID=A0ABN2AG83_9ACTN|nr:CoA transferase [Nocardioides humi]